MSFGDKSIQCSVCGTTFTFSAGERKFFASKNFTNEPRRCLKCRKSNKQKGRGLCGSWADYANRARLSIGILD